MDLKCEMCGSTKDVKRFRDEHGLEVSHCEDCVTDEIKRLLSQKLIEKELGADWQELSEEKLVERLLALPEDSTFREVFLRELRELGNQHKRDAKEQLFLADFCGAMGDRLPASGHETFGDMAEEEREAALAAAITEMASRHGLSPEVAKEIVGNSSTETEERRKL